jgi:hypothetical protein
MESARLTELGGCDTSLQPLPQPRRLRARRPIAARTSASDKTTRTFTRARVATA